MPQTHRPFSPLLFCFSISATLGVFYAVSALLFPGFTAAQFDSWQELAIVALCAHLAGAFFEFFFHRYVLHAPLMPGLTHFFERHERHHWLTVVRGHPLMGDIEYVRVRNVYPIEHEHQYEASFFPWYALPAFLGLITPPLVAMQWYIPTWPLVWGGYIGATFSMVLYELVHMVEHWPLQKLSPWFEHPTRGRFWQGLYAFHLRHHADKWSNESISGFFGIPIPDILFGTFRMPKTLYHHGSMVLIGEFGSPRPVFLIRWLDVLGQHARTRYERARWRSRGP